MRDVKAGDVFRHITPGAGGHGDPLERDPQRVLHDVIEEKLSAGHTRRVYGVVLDASGRAVDGHATEAERARLREARITPVPG